MHKIELERLAEEISSLIQAKNSHDLMQLGYKERSAENLSLGLVKLVIAVAACTVWSTFG